jgi:hypothetical protein
MLNKITHKLISSISYNKTGDGQYVPMNVMMPMIIDNKHPNVNSLANQAFILLFIRFHKKKKKKKNISIDIMLTSNSSAIYRSFVFLNIIVRSPK